MKSQVNWGIIGLGNIAHKFAQDLRFVHGARLHAVASSDAARAREFANVYGAEYAFGSYEAIVNCPHLDVVYIASTNEKHCNDAIMCLKRRIPVLCEKPLAINSHEVNKMLDAAHTHQTFLMEAMWSRFIPAFQRIIHLVNDGAIGRPLSIQADFGGFYPFDANWRIFDRAQGGGSLLDVGIYPITLALSILGKPQKINALADLNTVTGVDNTCAMQFGYADGAMALLNSSVTCKMPHEARIFGEKGFIHIPPRFHFPHHFSIYRYDGKNEPKVENVSMPYEGHGFRFEAEEVQRCLQNNQLESSIMPHAFSLDLIETMDAVRAKIGLVYDNHD